MEPLERSTVLNALNTQYSVFFGVIVSLSFTLDGPDGSKMLTLITQPSRQLFVALLTLYYFVDWLSANILPIRERVSLFDLLAMLTGVILLGLVTVGANARGFWFVVGFAMYVVVTTIWDFRAQQLAGLRDGRGMPGGLTWYIGTTMRAVIAFILLACLSLSRGRPDAAIDVIAYATWCAMILVVLKSWRGWILFQSTRIGTGADTNHR